MSNSITSAFGHGLRARFGMIGGDFVQQTGEGNVLSDSDADVNT